MHSFKKSILRTSQYSRQNGNKNNILSSVSVVRRQKCTMNNMYSVAMNRLVGFGTQKNDTTTTSSSSSSFSTKTTDNVVTVLTMDENEKKDVVLKTPESFAEKWHLYDWKVSAPLAMAVAIPVFSNGIYVVNEETQLAACFILFCTSVYKYGGDAIGSFFDARGDAILEEHNAVEDSMIKNCKEILSQYHLQLHLMDDISALNAMHKDIVALVCKVEIGKLKHDMRRLYIKNMDNTLMLEKAYTLKMQKDMVAHASDQVKSVLQSGSQDVKDDAFDSALRILEKKDKAETDQVVALYKKYLHEFYDGLKAKVGTTITMTDDEVAYAQKELDLIMARIEMPELELKAPKKYVYNLVE